MVKEKPRKTAIFILLHSGGLCFKARGGSSRATASDNARACAVVNERSGVNKAEQCPQSHFQVKADMFHIREHPESMALIIEIVKQRRDLLSS